MRLASSDAAVNGFENRNIESVDYEDTPDFH
jgi:hypothetical protein